jgi:hypothetical protein
MNLSPFYIGQKVVCIKSHSLGLVEKGKEYVIKDIQNGLCSHYPWLVDVGQQRTSNLAGCEICQKLDFGPTKDYVSHTLFTPIEEQQFSKVTYTEILEAVEMCNN